jgi:hypothetical protein
VSFRYSDFATISAPREEEPEAAVDITQRAAGESRFALRRLYADRASADTCTVPLWRGQR